MLGPGVQSSASLALWDAFAAVREHLFRAEQNNYLMQRAIDDLPSTGNLYLIFIIMKYINQGC